MHVDNMLGNIQISPLVALIQDHKEQIKSTHDRRAHLYIGTEGLFPVVATANRVSRRENGCTSVKSGMDTSFGDGNGLLFHGFVDGDLVRDVHLVKFVNGTNPVICQHESTGFNGEIAGFFVLDNGCCQTSGRGRLARSVDSTREEGADISAEFIGYV